MSGGSEPLTKAQEERIKELIGNRHFNSYTYGQIIDFEMACRAGYHAAISDAQVLVDALKGIDNDPEGYAVETEALRKARQALSQWEGK